MWKRVLTVELVLQMIIASMLIGVPATTGSESVVCVSEMDLLVHVPEDPVYLSIADDYVVVRLAVNRAVEVAEAYLVVNNREVKMKPQLYLVDRVVWFGHIVYTGSEISYYFRLHLTNGTTILVYQRREAPFFRFDGVNRYPQVSWVRSRVGYQVFPDRFYNGDPTNDHYALIYDALLYDNTTSDKPVLSNWSDPPHIPHHCCHQYYGGDLRGIIAKLDYLKELGVGLLYITPIFLCGSTHCYDTFDHYKLHPRFGTLDDLRELLEEAHRRNIKVVFDFVPGHVGLGHWAFQDVVVKGPNSTYWNWFTVYRWPFTPGDGRAYRCWWNLGHLPQLNTTVPEVKEHLINAVLHWLELGFDGVRIDTPLDLLNPREFFEELHRAVKSRFPNAYIVGEIWEQRPEWVNRGPFDSLMNYALGLGILVEYARGRYEDNIAYVLSSYYARYSVAVAGMGFNIVGSHDTDRVLTMLGGGRLFPEPNPPRESILRLKLMSTLQYTQPGAPIIFQGDERGLPGMRAYPWEEHRYPIQWDKLNTEVFEHYKKLGWFKNNLKPLHTSIIRVFETRGGVLAYTRGYNDEVLVVANNKLEPAIFKLPGELAEYEWIVLYSSSGEEPVINGTSIVIPPLTALLLLNAAYKHEIPQETLTITETEASPASTVETPPTSAQAPLHGAMPSHVLIGAVVVVVAITVALVTLRIKTRKHT
ncbi:MAG: glycoside hydrolase family 13 protein [Thermofilaceae archaeon]